MTCIVIIGPSRPHDWAGLTPESLRVVVTSDPVRVLATAQSYNPDRLCVRYLRRVGDEVRAKVVRGSAERDVLAAGATTAAGPWLRVSLRQIVNAIERAAAAAGVELGDPGDNGVDRIERALGRAGRTMGMTGQKRRDVPRTLPSVSIIDREDGA